MNFEKSSPTPTPSIVVSWRGSLIGTHVVSGQLAFLYDSSCLYLPGLRIELNYIKEVVVSSTSHAPKDPWGWYIYLHERLIFMGSSCRYIYRSSHGILWVLQSFQHLPLPFWVIAIPRENQVTVMRTADVSPGARGAPLKLPIEHERLTTKNDGKHIHRYIFWIYVVSFSDFRSFHWMKFFKHERSFSKNLLQKPSNNNGRENACAYSNAQRYICKQ